MPIELESLPSPFPQSPLSKLWIQRKEKKMARNYGFLVCLLIMILDIIAGILGIEAEIAQNKVFLSF